MTQLTIDLANINSGSGNWKGATLAIERLIQGLSFDGVEIERIPVVDPGIADAVRMRQRPEASVRILLNGHIDTVYGPGDPFQQCWVEGERLHGPGVADMKGGIAVLIAALRAFERCPLKDHVGWEILITADEEIGSAASRSLLEESARQATLGLTFESSLPDGALIRQRMGVGVFRALVKGRAAHSGRDFKSGRSAIALLAEWVMRLHALNKLAKGAIINVGKISGGGALNIVPDKAEAWVNIRASSNATASAILESAVEIRDELGLRDGYELVWEGSMGRPAKEVTPQLERLFAALQFCGRHQDLELQWRDTGGASDGNILQAAGLPVIDNLGPRGDHIHTSKEYIITESLVERAQLTASFLINLADGVFGDPRETFA